jgi:hypothetical protein
MNYGLTFQIIDPTNPLGLFFKTRFLELGVSQNTLAEKLEIKPSGISNIFKATGDIPTFSTPVGDGLVDLMLAAERAQWAKKWQKGVFFGPRRFPAGRPDRVRNAALAMSFWGRTARSSKGDGNRNREFCAIMRLVDAATYQEMIQMLWLPYAGAIVAEGDILKHVEVVSSRRGYKSEYVENFGGAADQGRGAMGELIFAAEQRFAADEAFRVVRILSEAPKGASVSDILKLMSDEERAVDADEHVYDAEVLSLALNGHAEQALRRIAQRYDGWQDWQREKDEEAWQAAQAEARAKDAAMAGRMH